MKELIVCGVAEITQHAQRSTAAISIWDPALRDTDFQAGEIHSLPPDCLVLHFDDVQSPRDGRVPPSLTDAEAIVNFARGLPDDATLLVHCWAGISRSTAAAYLALCATGVVPSEAIERVAHARSTLWPHRRLVELGASVLGDPEIITAMDAFISRLPWNRGPAQ